ncbi:CDP-diacylglycerol--glycerol-3-phosphate 3-phosphatidyltransferase [Candidatus Comchoanobacter bicostacola]|uniref:CDP-diacylglycerol--glycerol-3-phosphate 3-phosphatidyltransferase n=1 Tax=Candidatus Comchoanobacter bicostacola TaxID=2919598 RepID=A0ABY5DN01_9GAMM|nr:CDP-diacylglycerol--glycerol-3-phosphate 3-phosphatidyltransferase [Candidatus Comchoanobacter bicostacola]UTC24972.1 CDP-diacylglycerol--glycerol-3-phosphate 3-phosphatidyltransferase [Candidatus Comchoanobacter bicostacola]
MNTPTKITLLRFILTPIVIITYLYESNSNHWASVSLFIIASLSDWFDGYAARKSKQETQLGRLLDPIADKFLVISVLMMLAFVLNMWVFHLLVSLVVLRDLLITSLREWASEHQFSGGLSPTMVAKAKTGALMVSITCLIAYVPENTALLNQTFIHFGMLLFIFATLLSYVSLGQYIKIIIPVLTSHRKK